MNLPDSAISFLGAFRGLFADLRDEVDFADVYKVYPIVHCYCFTRELEFENAKRDILQVSQLCGHEIPLP
jgi:tRNA (guanine37-N1)-methyltransferase